MGPVQFSLLTIAQCVCECVHVRGCMCLHTEMAGDGLGTLCTCY